MKRLSRWGKTLDPKNPLPEYPRPQMRRNRWLSLNGMWEYQIVQGNSDTHPRKWKPVCVPFAIGTKLSGVDRILQPGETLWYRKTFAYKPEYGHTFLNFEAVDQICTVYLNGKTIGRHAGGYAPFRLDITDLVKYQNSLMVRVVDDSDQGKCAFGKQRLNPKDIWYTPTAGIYGTVWVEELPEHAIYDIKITPDCDGNRVFVELAGDFNQAKIRISDAEGNTVHEGLTTDGHYIVPMEEYHVWSCDDPYLYNVEILTEDDLVTSYFGMRKFSAGRDAKGKVRFALNNIPLFLNGVLDQGITMDGGYTYASEEAMRYELQKVKDLGFNMIRMHVKVENRRWYYLCDRMGILVMQDMPNGGETFSVLTHQALPLFLGIRSLNDSKYKRFGREDELSRETYMHELDEMLDTLYNCVCIFAWVPFNEGWGQFDSERITDHIQDYDSTRLVDSASGWHDQGAGDFNSRHVYFKKFRMPRSDGRITLLSEFGGYSYLEYGHSEAEELFGYKKFKDKAELSDAVLKLFREEILPNVRHGLSGCVYTQLTDVETECNGLLTADREIVKVDEQKMKKLNERIIRRINR